MSRTLRIDIADGWYHVMSRGIESRAIFENNSEHEHFLELPEKMVDRFRVVLHGHVELDNHYHLILQTPEANLSAAIQWLNVSHAAWVIQPWLWSLKGSRKKPQTILLFAA
jgi:REP element-mobilizing transposase RayT